jgi:diguanylate cyclase (GGDEF)-like protein
MREFRALARTMQLPLISTALSEPGFRRKLTLAFLSVVLVVALALPVAFFAFAQIHLSTARSAKAADTLEQVDAFDRAIANIRVKARDYAQTRSPRDRDIMVDNMNVLTEGARDLSRLDLPPDEQQRWGALIQNVKDAGDQLRSNVDRGNGRRAIVRFDGIMETQVEAEVLALSKPVQDRGRNARHQIDTQIAMSAMLLVAVIVAALLVAIFFAWRIPRTITKRLDVLRRASHQLASGDLDARAEEREGAPNDEIEELTRDFNAMAGALKAQNDRNVTLTQQLEISLASERERATRDPLTNLRNHRYFQESLHAEIDRCKRFGTQVTIAMLDLDNFKQVNDRFGHQEGDAVLLRVTKGIADNLRPYDLACRLGGEEFGIIFPQTSAEDAKMVLDRIAQHVLPFGPKGERSTFSGGIATFPIHAHDQAELFKNADEAAYTAKHNGKAQSVIYDALSVVQMGSDEQLKRKSKEAVWSTASTLVSAVDQKDPYTRHHSELTGIYAATIARAMGLDEEQVTMVYRAGLLHDVGKVSLSDEVLRKPGMLNESEWAEIRQHPEFSYRILETADMEPVATWVRHHHEHYDGSGYPRGLAGDDIPLVSRIVLVADAFEAMTSDRVYRRALPTEQALYELHIHSGRQFDPAIASLMIELVRRGTFDQVRSQYGRTVEAVAPPQQALQNPQQQPPMHGHPVQQPMHSQQQPPQGLPAAPSGVPQGPPPGWDQQHPPHAA